MTSGRFYALGTHLHTDGTARRRTSFSTTGSVRNDLGRSGYLRHTLRTLNASGGRPSYVLLVARSRRDLGHICELSEITPRYKPDCSSRSDAMTTELNVISAQRRYPERPGSLRTDQAVENDVLRRTACARPAAGKSGNGAQRRSRHPERFATSPSAVVISCALCAR